MKGRENTGGFTLVEVMISVAILAIISSLIFGSFSRVFEARDLVAEVQDRYHNVRVALERLSREISMAFIYDCREQDTPMGDRRHQTLFKSESTGKIDRLVMTTFSHLRMTRDTNESDLNVLVYYGEDDPDEPSKTNLIRREKVRIDDEPEEGGVEMIMCHDIESLKYELWDDTKQDWVDEWDCSQIERLNQLPRLVRISLVVKDEFGQEIPFTTTARIFANKPLSNWIKPST